ncbi:MFS general substrate transporter [Periconia macrospinosa]|uniref:MFS general substrate transporter n=1 Tax=Periconia macrospinosa TaxID=97972 RepID=A0A2V1E7Z3_9PLEO|nr:MFS general substrate transporter [Periconia macrospinosa]
MVFLGILDDKHLQHVPATVVLAEEEHLRTAATEGLKRDPKNPDIILIPQPSADPNDPLNWPYVKKVVVISIIAFGSVLYAAVLAPLLSPALVVIAKEFDKPVGEITVISGYMLLVTAASGPIASAVSRKWGKRPVLIVSSLFGLLGTIIGSATRSYEGLTAGRVIQGGSISAFESLVISMIGDLFFVHQRGGFMTLIQFILAAASNFSAIIVGPIAGNLGWRYLFHMLIAFTALEVILLILFVPETTYIRDHRYDIDELAEDNLEDLAAAEKRHAGGKGVETSVDGVARVDTATSVPPALRPKKTFIQELAFINGTFSDDNLLQLLIAPFAVCLNVTVLWFVLLTGGISAFFVAQSYDIAPIFMAPPYSLDPAGAGYLSIGPFLGGLLGALFMGATLDPLIKWCAKKNNGIYEPEYRLLGMIPSIFAGIGLVLFGYTCQNHFSYYVTATFHGMDLFGIVCATVACSAYVIDAFRDMSSEIFIMNMVVKNLLFYGFSYFVNDWTEKNGPAIVFYVFGAIAFGMTFSTVIFFFWGKKYRSFWHRHNLLKKWGIRTHAEF